MTNVPLMLRLVLSFLWLLINVLNNLFLHLILLYLRQMEILVGNITPEHAVLHYM